MRLRFVLLVIGLFMNYGSQAQKAYIRLKSFQRIAFQNKPSFAWSGAAVAGGYNLRLSRKDNLNLGAEIGFLEWGAQTLAQTGYLRKFSPGKGIRLYTGGSLYNGMVLFRPKPFYTGAAEWQGGIAGRVSKRLDMGFFTAVRYSITPQYRHYSAIYSYWHFTAELVFIIKKPVRGYVTPKYPSF